MSFLFGWAKKSRSGGDTDPLLPQYEDDTSMQRQLHQKLHTYQMLRALSMGYMPSTDQTIVNLRTLLASDVLNPDTPGLSLSTHRLLRLIKMGLTEFIEALRDKDNEDQIQNFIWYMAHANISVNSVNIAKSASSAKAKADATAALASFKTIGNLLLTNSDFRVFLADINTIGRRVFADTAHSFSNAVDKAADQIEPEQSEIEALKKPGQEVSEPPTTEDLAAQTTEVADAVTQSLQTTGHEAVESLKQNVSDEKQKATLKYRLKQAVLKLRTRPDYSDAVSTVQIIMERYIEIYSKAADEATEALEDNINENKELDKAVKLFWSVVRNFGDKEAWEALDQRFQKVLEYAQDADFPEVMQETVKSVQAMLTDPDFYDNVEDKVDELKEKTATQPIRHDIEAFLKQLRVTVNSVMNDKHATVLRKVILGIWDLLAPQNGHLREIVTDVYGTLLPIFIRSVQCIPIPRMEVSSPDLDLLLENVILEPGRTIRKSTFLPYSVTVGATNDLTLTQSENIFHTTTATNSILHFNLKGFTISASTLSYWMKMHTTLLRFSSEGIASFSLDERGIDIQVDLQVSTDRLENILTPRQIKVKIHHLNYTLHNRLTAFAWLLKPVLRPVLRKVLEAKIRTAISDSIYGLNRELVFARERLRAVRVYYSNATQKNDTTLDIISFVRAITARFSPSGTPPAEQSEVDVRVGLTAPPVDKSKKKQSPFAGRYTPGSLVKTWEQEARDAAIKVDERAYSVDGWRNKVFDVPVGGGFS